MALEKEIDLFLRSRFTLIGVISYEEERVLDVLNELCERTKRALYIWDYADFFQPVTGIRQVPPQARDPLSALDAIGKM